MVYRIGLTTNDYADILNIIKKPSRNEKQYGPLQMKFVGHKNKKVFKVFDIELFPGEHIAWVSEPGYERA